MRICLFPALALLSLASAPCAAAPFEVKIHDEVIAPYKETTFEIEVKSAKPASAALPNTRVLQSRFEVAYGITPNSEISVNAFTSHYGGKTYFNGGKIAHMIFPSHDENGWFHYGLKNEINFVTGLDEPDQVFYEITPILAFQAAQWRLTLNLSVDSYMNRPRRTVFAPGYRLGYSMNATDSLALEYYSEMGRFGSFQPLHKRPDAAYLVFDTAYKKSTLSFGIGKGVNSVGDSWVLKFIGSIPIN